MPLVRLIFNPNEDDEQLFEVDAVRLTVGTADDTDITCSHPSLSARHFKLELRDDGWHLVDLRSKTGTSINDQPVVEQRIERGTVFKAGECYILFDVSEEEEPEEIAIEAQLPALSGAGTQLATADTAPCWRCQRPVIVGAQFCPHCGADQRGAYMPGGYVPPVETHMAPGAGLMPFIALMCSVLGFTVIGALAGIMLGLASIMVIRRRGGHLSDSRKAQWAVYLGVIWLLLIGAGVGWWSWSSGTTRRITRNEARAIETLKDIAVAETYLQLAHIIDRDGDGSPEYARFGALVSNAFLRLDEDLADGAVLDGYRFTLLRADEENFVCAAEPQLPGVTGRRTFMIRGDGFITGTEREGAEPLTADMELPRIESLSVIDSRADELIRDIHRVANAALQNQNYELAQAIVKASRERFPTADEITKLDSIEEKSDPFIVEIRARELLTEASNAVARGQLLRSIETLGQLRSNYATFSGIEQVERMLRQQSDTYAQQREQAAQELLNEAATFALQLEFDKAESTFRTVLNRYRATQAAIEAQKRLEQLNDQRTSQSAEQLWRDAQALNIETEFRDVLARIEQLTRAFAASSIVSQNADRIEDLRTQCRARVYAADADVSLSETNVFKALTSYRRAAELDPALVVSFASNFADALLFGVSNALSASDYDTALDYARQFQKLYIEPDRLPLAQLDRIRLELAKLKYDAEEYDLAIEYISGIDERLMDDPRAALLAGTIYNAAGDPERAALYLEHLVTQGLYLTEARPLLLASAADAAGQAGGRLFELIAEDPEWRQIVATFSLGIPNTGGPVPTTATWQHLCVSLCDNVEMTYELLTYSGSEADLFLEKQRARTELDAELRNLQKTLRESIARRRDALIELRDIDRWWSLAFGLATNTPPDELSEDMREHVEALADKDKYAELSLNACQAALMADIQNKTQLLDYLKSLVTRMEAKLPLRNVLNGVKKFLSDELTPKRSRQALSAIAEMYAVELEVDQLEEDFSQR